jgi:pimeloyl-ACP methyl ester carboxylesterase
MLLETHGWGSGERVALLVHGLMSDHRLWHRVGPELAARGYRVVAPDLRGHGASDRAASYAFTDFADDLAETLPQGADLVVGHSLGGLALSLAVGRLVPRRAVYCDPAWCLTAGARRIGPEIYVTFARMARHQIRFFNPGWGEEDLDIEMETIRLWDPAAAGCLEAWPLPEHLPEKPVVPSLVQLPEESYLVGPEKEALLRDRGFEVRRVKGTAHCSMRDDHDAFMKALEGWI